MVNQKCFNNLLKKLASQLFTSIPITDCEWLQQRHMGGRERTKKPDNSIRITLNRLFSFENNYQHYNVVGCAYSVTLGKREHDSSANSLTRSSCSLSLSPSPAVSLNQSASGKPVRLKKPLSLISLPISCHS
jgi:hypothetical protein